MIVLNRFIPLFHTPRATIIIELTQNKICSSKNFKQFIYRTNGSTKIAEQAYDITYFFQSRMHGHQKNLCLAYNIIRSQNTCADGKMSR